MSKIEWEFATNDENLAQMDEGMRRLVKPSLEAIKDRVELIEGEQQIVDGVRVIPAVGHTVGHLAVLFDGGGEKLLHIVDAAHHPLQVKYPHVTPTFDALPDVSPQTRRDLFQKACDEGLMVASYHFDFPALGCVIKDGDGLEWKVYGD
jgi:glyoxylase-like metal-dependent hydrolase (beta-lactamase superfamily II)